MEAVASEDEYEVYGSEELSFQEYLEIFRDIILEHTSCRGIHKTLVRYVTSVIEPVGWQAVWKRESTKTPSVVHDILIEVLDVSLDDLEAEVRCLKLCPKEDNYQSLGDDAIDKLMLQSSVTTPLLQLYPAVKNDPTIYLEPTINVLNLLRFFYSNLWRPWDYELNDETDIFATKYLEPRLQLYFDATTNVIPQATINKIGSLIAEGQSIMKKLSTLRQEMNAEEDGMELEADDVLACMELTMRLEAIQKEAEMLENPLLRNLIKKQDIQLLSPRQKLLRPTEKAVTHVVGKVVTYSMIKNLPLGDNDVVLFHDNLTAAVSCSRNSDTILLLPGTYTCEGLGWLEHCISIKGLSDSRSETVLQTTAELSGDIFMNCCARDIRMCDLTLQVVDGAVSNLVTVHQGKLTLQNVLIQTCSPAIADYGISILEEARLVAENVKITNFQTSGVFLSYGGNCELKNSEIEFCHRGFTADLVKNGEIKKMTSLMIESCSITEILEYGFALFTSDAESVDGHLGPKCFSRLDNFDFGYVGTNNIHGKLGQVGAMSLTKNRRSSLATDDDREGIEFDPENEINKSSEYDLKFKEMC